MSIFYHSFTNFTASILAISTIASVAQENIRQTNPKVSLEGFNCALQHADIYLQQRNIITINFSKCPALPSRRDIIMARRYTGTLPNLEFQDYQEVEVLQFTREQLLCLVQNQEEILYRDLIEDSVAIEPEPCGALGFPIFDEIE